MAQTLVHLIYIHGFHGQISSLVRRFSYQLTMIVLGFRGSNYLSSNISSELESRQSCSCNSQAFPKDLQEYLSSKIVQFPNVKVQSSLYPTYKSVKPIAHATRNFLEWYLPVLLSGAIGVSYP